MRIRAAVRADFAALDDIERRAGEAFRDLGMAAVADDDPMPHEALERHRAAGLAWVAAGDDGRVAGYLVAEVLDGALHIEQVTVDPAYARQRIGRSLMDHAAVHARDLGLAAVTLTTFADVAWNAPWYARCGFAVVPDDETGPGLRAVRAREAEHGLDRWPRVVMRRHI